MRHPAASPFSFGDGQKRYNCRVTADRAHIERDWRARGFSCGLWVDPPGQVWEDYVHSTDELLMVLEGELELEMQGRTFRPKNGEEVLIPFARSICVNIDLEKKQIAVRLPDGLKELNRR